MVINHILFNAGNWLRIILLWAALVCQINATIAVNVFTLMVECQNQMHQNHAFIFRTQVVKFFQILCIIIISRLKAVRCRFWTNIICHHVKRLS